MKMTHFLLIAFIALSFSVSAENVDKYDQLSVNEIIDFELEQYLDADYSSTEKRVRRRPVPTGPIICVARNYIGRKFSGISRNLHKAKRRAIRNCREASYNRFSCHIIRCRARVINPQPRPIPRYPRRPRLPRR